MNTPGLARFSGALLALALCSACGGGSAAAPSGTAPGAGYTGYVGKMLWLHGRPVTAARVNESGVRYMPIVPDRHRSRKRFEYVINDYGSYASIFDYPKSTSQIGTIYNVGGQGCTNVLYGYGNKTFWIVAGANQITDYEVPQKPLKTLSVSEGMPSSCAMDTSGDLAVGILDGSFSGDVVIFKNATGTGTNMSTPLFSEYFDGYDNKGNLFADGFNNSGFALVELPKGSSKFVTVTTSNSIQFPGSVQWDGKYLTVFDQVAGNLYQYTVTGTTATLKGTVSLLGAGDCAQTWIATGVIYCGDADNNNGSVYSYPAGGTALAVFTGNFDEPLGVVAARK